MGDRRSYEESYNPTPQSYPASEGGSTYPDPVDEAVSQGSSMKGFRSNKRFSKTSTRSSSVNSKVVLETPDETEGITVHKNEKIDESFSPPPTLVQVRHGSTLSSSACKGASPIQEGSPYKESSPSKKSSPYSNRSKESVRSRQEEENPLLQEEVTAGSPPRKYAPPPQKTYARNAQDDVEDGEEKTGGYITRLPNHQELGTSRVVTAMESYTMVHPHPKGIPMDPKEDEDLEERDIVFEEEECHPQDLRTSAVKSVDLLREGRQPLTPDSEYGSLTSHGDDAVVPYRDRITSIPLEREDENDEPSESESDGARSSSTGSRRLRKFRDQGVVHYVGKYDGELVPVRPEQQRPRRENDDPRQQHRTSRQRDPQKSASLAYSPTSTTSRSSHSPLHAVERYNYPEQTSSARRREQGRPVNRPPPSTNRSGPMPASTTSSRREEDAPPLQASRSREQPQQRSGGPYSPPVLPPRSADGKPLGSSKQSSTRSNPRFRGSSNGSGGGRQNSSSESSLFPELEELKEAEKLHRLWLQENAEECWYHQEQEWNLIRQVGKPRAGKDATTTRSSIEEEKERLNALREELMKEKEVLRAAEDDLAEQAAKQEQSEEYLRRKQNALAEEERRVQEKEDELEHREDELNAREDELNARERAAKRKGRGSIGASTDHKPRANDRHQGDEEPVSGSEEEDIPFSPSCEGHPSPTGVASSSSNTVHGSPKAKRNAGADPSSASSTPPGSASGGRQAAAAAAGGGGGGEKNSKASPRSTSSSSPHHGKPGGKKEKSSDPRRTPYQAARMLRGKWFCADPMCPLCGGEVTEEEDDEPPARGGSRGGGRTTTTTNNNNNTAAAAAGKEEYDPSDPHWRKLKQLHDEERRRIEEEQEGRRKKKRSPPARRHPHHRRSHHHSSHHPYHSRPHHRSRHHSRPHHRSRHHASYSSSSSCGSSCSITSSSSTAPTSSSGSHSPKPAKQHPKKHRREEEEVPAVANQKKPNGQQEERRDSLGDRRVSEGSRCSTCGRHLTPPPAPSSSSSSSARGEESEEDDEGVMPYVHSSAKQRGSPSSGKEKKRYPQEDDDRQQHHLPPIQKHKKSPKASSSSHAQRSPSNKSAKRQKEPAGALQLYPVNSSAQDPPPPLQFSAGGMRDRQDGGVLHSARADDRQQHQNYRYCDTDTGRMREHRAGESPQDGDAEGYNDTLDEGEGNRRKVYVVIGNKTYYYYCPKPPAGKDGTSRKKGGGTQNGSPPTRPKSQGTTKAAASRPAPASSSSTGGGGGHPASGESTATTTTRSSGSTGAEYEEEEERRPARRRSARGGRKPTASPRHGHGRPSSKKQRKNPTGKNGTASSPAKDGRHPAKEDEDASPSTLPKLVNDRDLIMYKGKLYYCRPVNGGKREQKKIKKEGSSLPSPTTAAYAPAAQRKG